MRFFELIIISLIFISICQTESHGEWHHDNDQSNFSINRLPPYPYKAYITCFMDQRIVLVENCLKGESTQASIFIEKNGQIIEKGPMDLDDLGFYSEYGLTIDLPSDFALLTQNASNGFLQVRIRDSANNDILYEAWTDMNTGDDSFIHIADEFLEEYINSTTSSEVMEVEGENTELYTPMGRGADSVVIYDDSYPLFYLPNGTNVILDYGLFLNKSTKRFSEDIDGKVSFDPDQVSVGLYLMETFENDKYLEYLDAYDSIYDSEVNELINKLMVNNIEHLKPMEHFSAKPYKFEIKYIEFNENYSNFYPYQEDHYDCEIKIIEDAKVFDLIIAPINCFYDTWSGNFIGSFEPLEFYIRDEFIELAADEVKKQEKEYQQLVERTPGALSWLDIPPSDGEEYIDTCTVNSITNIQTAAAIIQRWENYYEPIYFTDINSLFMELTQKKENNCNDLLLTLEDKERLKKALDRKSLEYIDYREIIGEEILNLDYIDSFYSTISIPDEDFYNFFAQYNYDVNLFEELLKNNIDTKDKLDKLILNIKAELPNYSTSTNQQIYDFLILREEATERAISVSQYIEELEKLRLQELAEEAERQRAERERFIKDYPYYVKISCNLFGSERALAICFSGQYTQTTITLNTFGQTREKKYINFRDLGYFEAGGEALIIDLPREFSLTAQNASDVATLRMETYNQKTDELLEVDEAAAQYGIVSSYN